jgi:hypothetical protein
MFDVAVDLKNYAQDTVARMTVEWHVRLASDSSQSDSAVQSGRLSTMAKWAH